MPLEAAGLPVKTMQVLWRSRELVEVKIGIFEPKKLLVKAVKVFVKAVRVHVKRVPV